MTVKHIDASSGFMRSEPFGLRLITSNRQYPSSAKDTTICNNWLLSLPQISELISQLTPLSGEDWHHLFEHLPCQVVGELDQDGVSYSFSINGGSWSTVTSKDTTIYFGDVTGRFKSSFITAAWNPEEEK